MYASQVLQEVLREKKMLEMNYKYKNRFVYYRAMLETVHQYGGYPIRIDD